jgi:SAM-dependent methyltransferase
VVATDLAEPIIGTARTRRSLVNGRSDEAVILRALTTLGMSSADSVAKAIADGEQSFADACATAIADNAIGNTAALERLYRALLGREPDAPGLASHLEAIEAGGANRMKVVEAILDSKEFAAGALSRALESVAKPAGSATHYARPRVVASIDHCHFYHTMELPGLGVVRGEWDLRNGIDAYLGGVNVRGCRVLDLGAASGFVSFELERRGADVTAYDLPEDGEWDVVPRSDRDLQQYAAERRRLLHRLRNSFWLAHRVLGSKVRLIQGRADRIPSTAGRFDVSIVSSILMHLRDPVAALEAVARITDSTIVVAERVLLSDPNEPLLLFRPARESMMDTWWAFTPAAISGMLSMLGFYHQSLIYHQQPTGAGMLSDYFTIVGARRGRVA